MKKQNEKKIKVLFITSKFPRYPNDPQPAFPYYLAKELIKKGIDVSVIAPHDSGAKRFEIIDGIKIHRFVYFLPKSKQQLAYKSGIPDNFYTSIMPKVQMIPFALSQIAFSRKISKMINPDIIHVHWGLPQGISALFTNKPYIMTIYGGEVFLAKNFRINSIFNKIISKSKGTYAITNGLKDIMTSFGVNTKNIRAIPLGVNEQVFHPNITGSKEIRNKYCKKDEKMVLCVGRIVEKKGIDYLLKAFDIVSKEYSKAKLVIVGGGVLYDKMRKLCTNLRLDDKVTFVGEINHKDLPKYYDACDFFVLPSIVDSTGNRETQGVVYVEAMITKKPVIGTNTGGIPDVIVDGKVGYMVPEKDEKELAKAILKLLKDQKLTKKMGLAAYKRAKEIFTWEKISEQYIKIYEKIINKN